jgi:hypothetical protein
MWPVIAETDGVTSISAWLSVRGTIAVEGLGSKGRRPLQVEGRYKSDLLTD